MSEDLSAPAEDPELRSPLGRFGGERPPAPAWFDAALAQAPERSTILVEGANLELLTWGEVGKPGILFLHGARAHADWWSFIAPFFAQTHRVAALSWSGMGRSDWRDSYTADVLAQEALTAAEAGGLFQGPEAPLMVAHSFGGWIGMYLAGTYGARFKAAAILDSGVRPPRDLNTPPSPQHTFRPPRPNRVYASLTDALAHFRLAPTQTCGNPFILDYIAREALKPAPMEDGSCAMGWTWRFDPFLFAKIEKDFQEKVATALPAAQCPIAMMWGETSALMTGAFLEHTKTQAPVGSPLIEMPQAAHHLFLDDPLGFVTGLRSLFAGWPR
jgi:pimeloyl-ACP methyl ester carboxylesterase